MNDAARALVDKLFDLKRQKAELNKQAESLDAEQAKTKAALIEMLNASGATACSAPSGTGTMTMKSKADLRDWAALRAFIEANKALDLLERRVSRKACQERWQAGVTVPGVDRVDYFDISLRENKSAAADNGNGE